MTRPPRPLRPGRPPGDPAQRKRQLATRIAPELRDYVDREAAAGLTISEVIEDALRLRQQRRP